MSTAHELLQSKDPLIEEIGEDDDKDEDFNQSPCNTSSCCGASPLQRIARIDSSDCDPPTSGGPRLGNLKGLGESRKNRSNGVTDSNNSSKGKLKLMPIILMIIVFGPAILPAFIYLYDKVATSQWGINAGLTKSFEDQLTEFYRIHNPAKLREVKSIAKKYKGKEKDLMQRLKDKYKRLEDLRREDEKYST